MLSDRIKIMRKAAAPEVILAPQVLINCGGGGDCDGGDVGGVFDYLSDHGVLSNREPTLPLASVCLSANQPAATPALLCHAPSR